MASILIVNRPNKPHFVMTFWFTISICFVFLFFWIDVVTDAFVKIDYFAFETMQMKSNEKKKKK